jgi:hypothetical protein
MINDPMIGEMFNGLVDQQGRLLARPLLAQQDHKGRLAGAGVLADPLAGGRLAA